MNEQKKAQLDGTDAAILSALLEHPRTSVLGLAENLGYARSTVQIRLARLERLGLLSLEGAGPVAGLAGYSVLAFMTVEVRQRDVEALRLALAEIPEVIEAYGITGVGDILCRVVARDNEDLGRVNALVLECPGAQRARTSVVVRPMLNFRVGPLLKEIPR